MNFKFSHVLILCVNNTERGFIDSLSIALGFKVGSDCKHIVAEPNHLFKKSLYFRYNFYDLLTWLLISRQYHDIFGQFKFIIRGL